MAKIAVIGSGFSGLSAAAYLSKYGHEVHIYEKNSTAGGRARQIQTPNGFVFDMGPSWYWMPDVYERFFSDFGHAVSDFYDLKLLEPSFDIVYAKNDVASIPSDLEELGNWFESIEKGSKVQLQRFMKEAAFKYDTAMAELIYKPGLSLAEFADLKLIKNALKLQVFSSLSRHLRQYFTHPKLLALMEFPVLFLGAMPEETPALYSLMNYAGLQLGTWYPQGGFGSVVDGFLQVAQEQGTQIHYNATVEKINYNNGKAHALVVNGETILCDGIIAAADYHHVESMLLDNKTRNYSEKYWTKKTFAPSSLIFYIGLNQRIDNLNHHTLFFDESLAVHSQEIYKDPKWPSKPLFYLCCPSKTDDSVAPKDHENLFFLMPLAPGIEDTPALREKYLEIILSRLQSTLGIEIKSKIVYNQSYCINDFVLDYNSYKGNAYGLANTLAQTAILKPKIKNHKIKNLFYAGQLTVPGPGVPPAIISGKIAAGLLHKTMNKKNYEVTV